MNKLNVLFFSAILLSFSLSANATPTLQVHGVGSTAGSIGGDEDSWLLSDEAGSLELIGSFKPGIVSIESAYLVLTTSDNNGAGNVFGSGYDKYDDSNSFESQLETIFPDAWDSGDHLNNHNPYGLAASEVDIYAYELSQMGIGSFANIEETMNCDADNAGATECVSAGSTGQTHTFDYDYSNVMVDWVHFDIIALVTEEVVDSSGKRSWRKRWRSCRSSTTTDTEVVMNPGSHDTTWYREAKSVPEANSLVLLVVGLFGLLGLRRIAS